jgi:uracil-DNA glycosylase
MTELQPVDYLFHRLEDFGPYPQGVVPVPDRILGTAFFPGGSGLWGAGPNSPLPPMPLGGVMVLGHNFDSVAGVERSLRHAGENLNGPTWRGTLDLLDRVGIPREQCFFTNAYMGLIDGPSAVGSFPGKQNSNFVGRCRNFLHEQIVAQQPRLILTLGLPVLGVLAPLSPMLGTVWSDAKTFRKLDDRDSAIIYPARFVGVVHAVAVVALVHPAYRLINVRTRHYHGFQGDAAELQMVAEALRISHVLESDLVGTVTHRSSRE